MRVLDARGRHLDVARRFQKYNVALTVYVLDKAQARCKCGLPLRVKTPTNTS